MNDYSAVVLYFKAGPKLAATMSALLAQSIPPIEVVVVDNCSQDGVAEDVVAELADSRVRLLRLPENVGYAGGMNAGVRFLKAPVRSVLLLTHEVLLQRDATERLLLDAPAAVLAGPLLRRASTGEVWSAGGTLDSDGLTGHLKQPKGGNLEAYDVDWLDGAALLADRAALEAAGGLDERYFLYWEDVDLGARLKRLGRVVCVPRALAVQETGLTPPYFASRNRVLFWRRHGSSFAVLRSISAEVRSASKSLVRRRPRCRDAAARLVGLFDGISGGLHSSWAAVRTPDV